MSLTNNIDNIFKKGVVGKVRKAQEDSHDMALKTPNGDVFVVCDGMGGHVGGAKASSLAVESIISYLKAEKYPNPIEALNGALQFANMQILGFADANPEYKGMGTTACIVLVQNCDAWIAHVGDSRIYLYLGKEKKLHRITKDHSFVQALVDQGEITDEQAEHHPNKNRILKALGIKPELHPTFNYENHPIHPLNGDIFLICSDGLSGEICDATIEKVLSENATLEARGEKLITLAMLGENGVPGGKDNCTLELIQVDNSPWKKRQFKSYNPAKGGSSQKRQSSGKSKKGIIIGLAAAVFVSVVILAYFLFLTPEQQLKRQMNKEYSEWQDAEKKVASLCKGKKESNKECIKLRAEADSLHKIYSKDSARYSDMYMPENEKMSKGKGETDKKKKKDVDEIPDDPERLRALAKDFLDSANTYENNKLSLNSWDTEKRKAIKKCALAFKSLAYAYNNYATALEYKNRSNSTPSVLEAGENVNNARGNIKKANDDLKLAITALKNLYNSND